MEAELELLGCQRDPDGGFTDTRGMYCDRLEDLLQNGIFGFCMCGCPEENLEYIRAGLDHIEKLRNAPRPWSRDWYEEHRKESVDLFGNSEAEYFFYYWADKEEYTEHGSSVPGWLTDKGMALLNLLNAHTKSLEPSKE